MDTIIASKSQSTSIGCWPAKISITTTVTLLRTATGYGVTYDAQWSGLVSGHQSGGPRAIVGNEKSVLHRDPDITLSLSEWKDSGGSVSVRLQVVVDKFGSHTIFDQVLAGNVTRALDVDDGYSHLALLVPPKSDNEHEFNAAVRSFVSAVSESLQLGSSELAVPAPTRSLVGGLGLEAHLFGFSLLLKKELLDEIDRIAGKADSPAAAFNAMKDALFGAAGAVLGTGPLSAVVLPLMAALAAYIQLARAVIAKVDKGKGVKLSWTWLQLPLVLGGGPLAMAIFLPQPIE